MRQGTPRIGGPEVVSRAQINTLDLPAVLRQLANTQNPLNGELSYGVVA